MALSRWVNLQDVFKANAGQGQRMVEDVYGGLEKQGDEARMRLKNAATTFETRGAHARDRGIQSMSSNTADEAERSGQVRYGGPRTLGEVDSGVAGAVGDAVKRLGGSAIEQYQGRYGTSGGAYGGALDRAMMNRAGGAQRAAGLKERFGGLRGELGAAQLRAEELGAGYAGDVETEALRRAGMVGDLRNAERLAALRKESDDSKRRAAFEAQQDARNRGFNRRRGNQLQAAYARDFMDQGFTGYGYGT